MRDTDGMTYDQALSTRKLLEEVWEAIDAGEEYEETDPTEYLDQMALELVWELGEPFAVVLGTGGPHVEIVGGGRQGEYTLNVYWASYQTTMRGEAITRTGDYFRQFVDHDS